MMDLVETIASHSCAWCLASAWTLAGRSTSHSASFRAERHDGET
jgi:hypothetical protein